MAGQIYTGFLRQVSTGGAAEQLLPPYPLSEDQEIAIGRDPSCQIVLDHNQYTIVSRRHAIIRPVAPLGNGLPRWEICDQNSANGTYINRQKLQGCQQLKAGDRIELGQHGPQFIFDCQFNPNLKATPLHSPPNPTNVATPKQTSVTPVGSVAPRKSDSVTFSQLFPLASTGRDLKQKAFLIPGILTVVFVVLMFAAVDQQDAFNLLLAIYLAGAAYFFIYRLCGKRKPWSVSLFCAISTSLILVGPLLPVFITVFRKILPGSLPNQGDEISFLSLLIRMFFGAGLMEELIKALPVLGLYVIGRFLRPPWREWIGVWEPLDGILLGAASAVGFTLMETLGQYVPGIIHDTLQAGQGNPQLLGLQLLIPRIIGSVVGHMAYSGYFGYFIGLSVLKPSQRWQILGIGYLCAAILHALWNSTGYVSPLLLAVVGVVSYAFLGAAILKARELSPTRSQNFATRFFGK
ncbi:MAG TPA: PrsW family intramembrane metalloprotease [Cyanobacteria bacterium UBA8543]|nr:PrsW family intramembrane metalloprotease [Cyanobacteria bacterium UBA8543]